LFWVNWYGNYRVWLSWVNWYCNYRDPSEKSTPRVRGHFKVVGTDTDRSAIYDFPLVIRSNHEPISYRFRDKLQILQILATRVFNVHGNGFPLEFCNGGGAKKN